MGSDSAASTADRRASRQKAVARSRWRASIGAVLAVALVVLVLLASLDLVLSAGRIHHGVSVSGVDLGGKTPTEAKPLLDRELSRRVAEPVLLVAGDEKRAVNAGQVALSFDTTSLAQAAYGVGRSGSLLADASDRLRAYIGGTRVAAEPSADAAKTSAVIASFAQGVDVSARDAVVLIDGTDVSVRPSASGSAVDRQATKAMLLAAFLSADRTVRAPVLTTAPRVTDAQAEAAAAEARQMISAPVEVSFASKRWTFDPEDIAGWVSFRPRGSESTGGAVPAGSSSASETPQDPAPEGDAVESDGLEAFVDADLARKDILGAVGAVGTPAQDATFKVSGGRVSIVPSRDGVGPDIEALALQLTHALKDPQRARTVALRTRRTHPKITTAKARTMGITERISRYTTTYSPSNRPRVANIHLLAGAIDGTLIEPGGTFSFNGTVGPRTAAKGYQEAPAIVDGKLVPQLGGGICQVGTTLFNTVFESGLPVLERHNHSFYISHYPKGRDATVSWGGPDFKFKNDTGHWMLLVTAYSSSSLTIALYGTDPGYEVEAQAGSWENERPYKTEETKDPTLPLGARVVEDGGITGRSVTVKRIVWKDGTVVRTDEFRSVYRPKVEVVRVGTKSVAPGKTATQTVAPAN